MPISASPPPAAIPKLRFAFAAAVLALCAFVAGCDTELTCDGRAVAATDDDGDGEGDSDLGELDNFVLCVESPGGATGPAMGLLSANVVIMPATRIREVMITTIGFRRAKTLRPNDKLNSLILRMTSPKRYFLS